MQLPEDSVQKSIRPSELEGLIYYPDNAWIRNKHAIRQQCFDVI
jgi:hypothetical protein